MKNEKNLEISLLTSSDWKDYALLDCGGGRKLERFGKIRLIRPEAEAVWQPTLSVAEWDEAQAEFIPSAEENGGHWLAKGKHPGSWRVQYKNLTLKAELSNSKQLGVFPEQACQWDWVSERIQKSGATPRILNLFGYTGAITMAAAQAGAQVTHLDASKKAISWAKENQELCRVANDRIRWIEDDALKFVQRELRRASVYDGIILDPPKFGRGPKGEVWEFYKSFPSLLKACADILSPKPLFVLITAYAVKASSVTLNNALAEAMAEHQGELSSGEVCLQDVSGGRLLSMAVFSRWKTTAT